VWSEDEDQDVEPDGHGRRADQPNAAREPQDVVADAVADGLHAAQGLGAEVFAGCAGREVLGTLLESPRATPNRPP